MNALQQLEACGQAPWLDYLIRSLIEKGGLQEMIDRDGLKGITSNPSIFQKAIGESNEYAAAIQAFRAGGAHTTTEIYEHLAISDIQSAADVLKPVYDRTNGRDGYVSLECSPLLANDTDATIAEAIHLWTTVNRPNLMVKVPATSAGIPAVRQLIGRGFNINITLLFSIATYEEVVEAYLSGLETLKATGASLSRVASVASFFVSRIDTAVEKQLETLSNKAAVEKLHGRVAIANARIAYAHYKALFSGPRWEALALAGAQTQRLLWASTSVKDTTLKDTLYVEALIGRDTVNTLPPATMDAFRAHGVIKADAIEDNVEAARSTLALLQDQGISLDDITAQLVRDGVQSFTEAFDKLFKSIADLPRT